MQEIKFFKYHGTGNDFIMIDNRTGFFPKANSALVAGLCRRRFGVGADGLILLEPATGCDFRMVYFNADGAEGTMCGNGGRCAVALAARLGMVSGSEVEFLACDGPHRAILHSDGTVALQMRDVDEVEAGPGYYLLDTGSPHYVVFVEDLDDIDVVENGKLIRYSDRFRRQGVNVNFVEKKNGSIMVRTYERGVEDETLSCGTGVTASALAYALEQAVGESTLVVPVETLGGRLEVAFEKKGPAQFRDVWLRGPTMCVYEGVVRLPAS
ncbi:MAG: diaminopimelate epimerase [Saprospiraceae bacterium]|nr:MAG: diaminopimelate epimerase [Saprospiraceae bacterium]